MQERIDTLSRRGKGNVTNDGPSVVSDFSGQFVLRNGALSFSTLRFAVPGAIVQLAGRFDLRAEDARFRGTFAARRVPCGDDDRRQIAGR